MIVCAAVVGQQNNPLYLKTYVPVEHEAKFHYIVHCSLDTVEEKVLLRRAPGEVSDSYLGLLYPTEEYRVFGYISNSQVKFVLVLDELNPKDEALVRVFRRLHHVYTDATSNPFYTYGLPLASPVFDRAASSIISAYAAS